MKNIPQCRKLKQRKWLLTFVTLALVTPWTSIPARAEMPFPYICQALMDQLSPKIRAEQKNQEVAEKKENDIRKLKSGLRNQPLNYPDVEGLVDYYRNTPQEFDAWLQDFRFRLDRGATTFSEDLAAVILISNKASEDWDALKKKRNIWVKQKTLFDKYLPYFRFQQNQPITEKQWVISKLGPRLINMKYGYGFARGYNLKLPQSVDYIAPEDLSLFAQPSLDFDWYMKGLADALHVVRFGSAEKPNLENDTTLDLPEKTLLEKLGPTGFIDIWLKIKRQKDVSKFLKSGMVKIGVIGFFTLKLFKYFFNAGAATALNGKGKDPENESCYEPYSANDDAIMIEAPFPNKNFSPFDRVFTQPRLDLKYLGQPNPCDLADPTHPDGYISSYYKQKLQELNNNESAFEYWEGANRAEMARLRDLIRKQYNYVRPNYSACARYYSWYKTCGPGKGDY